MTAPTGPGYPIARGTGRCAATGRQLPVGERYVATLVEREGQEGLERLDFGLEAWNSGARPEPPARLFATWRTVVPESNAKKASFLSDDELVDLFERLAEATEPKRVGFRYLLALILVRKKVLKYEGARDGAIVVRVRTPAGATPAEAVHVTDPGLDEETIAGAMEQLGEIMAIDAAEPSPARTPG